ncbi:MAG: glycosyltransferase family 2 protein [Paludibacteraceae bacterium]|nr:glycosyltransferase family 2 protein [Paludibacteraceae bacterium]
MEKDLTLAICVYNAEKYIVETLESVINQTFQNFNLLIIDDCSLDRSVVFIEKFFKEHKRQYDLVIFERNQGIGYARHYVEKSITTKYLMFLDADDILYPNAIALLYDKITSDEDLMAVGCYLEYMDSDGRRIRGGIFLGEKRKEEFYAKAEKGKLIFMQPTAIYDREVALSVGGHNMEGFPDGKPRYRDLCEDLDLWTRMSDLYVEGKAIVVVPEVLCRYRKHQQAMSTNAIGMVLRMRHIKTNVRRRRRGERDLTFVEFYEGLSDVELTGLRCDAIAADALRNAVFYLHRGNVFMFVWLVLKSIWYKPAYIGDKIKHNFIKK